MSPWKSERCIATSSNSDSKESRFCTPNECGALSLAEVWRDEHTKQTENSTEHTSVQLFYSSRIASLSEDGLQDGWCCVSLAANDNTIA
jgi:hypothetical protein